ncbi:hypothetical protein EDB85DRAFT_1891765 [Lactarius pseudohatsudake]|nr:hypothetical protein EDB85DRAFT_1891765 [Lactarius pseudohatsudake]
MVQNPLLLSQISKPLPCKRPGGNDACIRTAVVITGSQLNWGMLDIPAELLLVISSHMDHCDLRGLALTSRLLCDLLLREYFRWRGLKLKDGGTLWFGGLSSTLHYSAEWNVMWFPHTHISFHLFRPCLAPSLVQTMMGILNQSPIRHLVIYMVSLNRSQWLTLLGQLNMTLLEDIKVEGDIPRLVLIRFLIKHRGLRHFLPNLRTLHAPLTVCCDIIRRVSDPSNLYELQAKLVETLRHFWKLDNLGLQLVPSSTVPQASPGDYNWDGHPICELRQVHRLSFHQNRGQDMVCACIQSFPMPEVVHVVEEGGAVRLELLESLRKANSTLRLVMVFSGSFLKWTADGMVCDITRY